jgi:hypothetical protein
MFSTNRSEMRTIFFEAWRKYCEQLPLEALEMQIVNIILQHPEYHALLKQRDTYQEQDFDENNPFMHLSLHLAINEQINTNRPHGIQAIFRTFREELDDIHQAEHRLMDCLTDFLWQAHQSGGYAR